MVLSNPSYLLGSPRRRPVLANAILIRILDSSCQFYYIGRSGVKSSRIVDSNQS